MPDLELALQFCINQQLMNLAAQLLEVAGVPTQSYRQGDNLGGVHRPWRIFRCGREQSPSSVPLWSTCDS
ncbi:hypothetical protein PI125_g24257 [Phytophthora idaei]|nr:hypothetical protein PI125_g24257 [Phytophthora idaei]